VGAPRPYVPAIVKSEIPVPELSYQTRLDAVEDVRYRASVGADAGLPSVAFYTFTHAHGYLNCATVSRDAAIVAGGFADSAVRVWDMNKAVPGGADAYETDPESRARRAAKDAALDAPAAERGEGGDDATMAEAEKTEARDVGALHADTAAEPTGGRQTRGARLARPTPSTEYVGHASAVHGVSLSPGNEFLLSCSRDTTVRVWSLELETCLAAYRGHEAPVWDVRWCDRGHYFATASYDKTARVWAMDSPPRAARDDGAPIGRGLRGVAPQRELHRHGLGGQDRARVGRGVWRVRADLRGALRRRARARHEPGWEIRGERRRGRRRAGVGPGHRARHARLHRAPGAGILAGLRGRRARERARERGGGRDGQALGHRRRL